MNSLKSYHALKCEQSKIFATSLKEEVIQTLRDMLKKETTEARKIVSNGRQIDMDMRSVIDRLEAVGYFSIKVLLMFEIDETQIYNCEYRH